MYLFFYFPFLFLTFFIFFIFLFFFVYMYPKSSLNINTIFYNVINNRSLFHGSLRALEERYGPAPPSSTGPLGQGAEAYSLWMAALCPLSDREKARLLKTTDTAERLRTAVACFGTAMCRMRPSVTGAGVGTGVGTGDVAVGVAGVWLS